MRRGGEVIGEECAMPIGVYTRKPDNPAKRFWSKVDKGGPTLREDLGPCWLWTAQLFLSGYGRFTLAGKRERAHRVAWMLTNGAIPEGLWVLHRCDNPRCVNSERHLFLGTPADNAHDRDAKGRQGPPRDWFADCPERRPRGDKHWRAKLASSDVVLIRKRVASGQSHRRIAREYGVDKSTVTRIAARRSWSHVP